MGIDPNVRNWRSPDLRLSGWFYVGDGWLPAISRAKPTAANRGHPSASTRDLRLHYQGAQHVAGDRQMPVGDAGDSVAAPGKRGGGYDLERLLPIGR